MCSCHFYAANLICRKAAVDGYFISPRYMVRKFLVSNVMIDDEYEDTIVGTPQGGNISPLLANIMLNELDKELEARGLDFVASMMR